MWCFIGRLGDYKVVLEVDEASEWEAAFPGTAFQYPGPRGWSHAYRKHTWMCEKAISNCPTRTKF
jgi:hypothetical protein